MQQQTPNQDYRNPKIHSDLMLLYVKFFGVHQNMSKYLRVAILEKEVLEAVSMTMRLTIQVNAMRVQTPPAPSTAILEKTGLMRSYVENIKAFTTLLWQLKAFSEGFFIDAMAHIEGISKQIGGWQKFLLAADVTKK